MVPRFNRAAIPRPKALLSLSTTDARNQLDRYVSHVQNHDVILDEGAHMTEWKAHSDVLRSITSLEPQISSKAQSLFALSTILMTGRVLREFDSIKGLDAACPLSEYGSRHLNFTQVSSFLSSDDKSIVALSAFYHRDYLIDVENSDVDTIMEVVDKLIRTGAIIFPDRHGRILYDRFKERYSEQRLEFLPVEEVATLTGGIQNGVYQAGQLIVGPLGILASSEGRWLRPDKRVPLWHCADPGCGVIHLVELHNAKTKIVRAIAELKEALVDKEGPASDWEGAFSFLSRSDNEGRYFDLVPLLVDGFDESEKRLIFEAAMNHQDGKSLRDIIAARINKAAGQGPAPKVAANLSSQQIVQLLATLPTDALIRILDSQILSERVSIPRSEVRSLITPIPKRKTDMPTEISSLGVRTKRIEPAAFLSAIIYAAYQKSGDLADLAWRCKTNDATPATVLIYTSLNGPKAAVNDLVLPSKLVFEQVCLSLSIVPVSTPTASSSDVILWKSGFGVSRYDGYLSLFRSSLSEFSDAVLALPIKPNDIDREKIRAAAINSFVYAERFIEDVVAFNIWLLISDHFGNTKFEYKQIDAFKNVADTLGDVVSAGASTFSWNRSGGNTLGVSLVYGRAACNLFENLLGADRRHLARAEGDYPHYASPRSTRFPFKHIQLWADADQNELKEYIDQFVSLISMLEKARTAEIRNGVQHYRDNSKFPSKELLIDCSNLLLRALDMADVRNLTPKHYWASSKSQDSFGITQWTMVDYNGRESIITLPFASLGMVKPTFDEAYIIEGVDILGAGSGKIIFKQRESSSYSLLWEGYHQVVRVGRVDAEIIDS